MHTTRRRWGLISLRGFRSTQQPRGTQCSGQRLGTRRFGQPKSRTSASYFYPGSPLHTRSSRPAPRSTRRTVGSARPRTRHRIFLREPRTVRRSPVDLPPPGGHRGCGAPRGTGRGLRPMSDGRTVPEAHSAVNPRGRPQLTPRGEVRPPEVPVEVSGPPRLALHQVGGTPTDLRDLVPYGLLRHSDRGSTSGLFVPSSQKAGPSGHAQPQHPGHWLCLPVSPRRRA